ncbi:MAG: AraC family transcriptional regulator [Planctomycetota bacterium]|nr:AraC family transcriptional regulator [Planctomycetota bacterium]
MASIRAEAFLDALLHPACRVEFLIHNFTRVPADWRFDRRTIEEHLVYYVVEHVCRGRVDGKTFYLEPHSLMWLPPRKVHTLANADPRKPISLYHFRFDLLKGARRLDAGPGMVLLHGADDLRQAFAQLLDEYRARLPYQASRLRAMLHLLFTGVLRRAGARAAEDDPPLGRARRDRLAAYVEARLDRAIRPAELAAEVGLAPDYFTRVFRRTYGVPPRVWLVRARMRRAADRLVESNRAIGEIAAELGYENLYFFSRQFKQSLGLSPRAYRRRHARLALPPRGA